MKNENSRANLEDLFSHRLGGPRVLAFRDAAFPCGGVGTVMLLDALMATAELAFEALKRLDALSGAVGSRELLGCSLAERHPMAAYVVDSCTVDRQNRGNLHHTRLVTGDGVTILGRR